MKSTIKQNHGLKEFDYKNGLVVYINAKGKTSILACNPIGIPHSEKEFCGTIVYSEIEHWKIGQYSDTWTKEIWKEFSGEITLSH